MVKYATWHATRRRFLPGFTGPWKENQWRYRESWELTVSTRNINCKKGRETKTEARRTMSVKELRAGVFTLGRLFREVDPKSARGFFFSTNESATNSVWVISCCSILCLKFQASSCCPFRCRFHLFDTVPRIPS